MNRKEVENKIGFTRKEIRYLQNIGIIELKEGVQGKEYDYSNNDVKKFLLVRFFKDCGYKTNEIKEVFLASSNEKELFKEAISKMEKQIKKLNESIKLAKTMLRDDFISYEDYFTYIGTIFDNYDELKSSYILSAEIFNGDNIEEYYTKKYFKSIDKVIDSCFDELLDLDDMINDYMVSKKVRNQKVMSIIDEIARIYGFYSHFIVVGLFIIISKQESFLSERTCDFLFEIENEYYSKNKQTSFEYNLEQIEKDLIINLENHSFDNEIIQEILDRFTELLGKIIKKEKVFEVLMNSFNKPENIEMIMKKYNLNEQETKRRIDELIRAIEFRNN